MRARRWLLAATVVLFALLVVARVALPSVLVRYVDRALDRHPVYDGRIGNVDLALIRGEYRIDDVRITREDGAVAEPLFTADRVDLSILWSAMLDGAVVGEITLHRPRVRLVNGAAPERDQTGVESDPDDWRRTLSDLFPVRIDRLVVVDGAVHCVDRTADPAIDVAITGIRAEARNLTNSEALSGSLLASVTAEGRAADSGHLSLQAQFDPYAE